MRESEHASISFHYRLSILKGNPFHDVHMLYKRCNGSQTVSFRINYDVACPMNFRKYPYDTQKCKIKYESCECLTILFRTLTILHSGLMYYMEGKQFHNLNFNHFLGVNRSEKFNEDLGLTVACTQSAL